jgi:UDP-glucose 4-epimerase
MSDKMKILITGGVGYIGSHTVIQLVEAGYEIVIVDNLCNSKIEALNRVEEITNTKIKFYKTDLLEKDALNQIFKEEKVDAVIHFAGLKAVGESVGIPLHYYNNNVTGTINLLEAMKNNNVKKLVFSSSATVYGDPHKVPITEDFPLSATNPYGYTKLMIEQILKDLFKSDNSWDIAILRYFNPVGAHQSGRIGEDPNGIPNNLMPFISQVAVGKRESVAVFGNDYPTIDGTGVRDYIHVVDLANGHLKALEKLKTNPGCVEYNLGTGKGYSVIEVIKAFEKASNKKVPYKIVPRREGDIAACYANPNLAKKELDWEAKFEIEKMCEDSWRWQSQNPNGYEEN